jgi:ribA/ribD-fused uncharacterized protein
MSNKKIIIGDIDWLRNDYVYSITVGGVTYPSVEHAYQASKFTDKLVQRKIADTQNVHDARRIVRNYSGISCNWDYQKLSVMEVLLRQKFSANTHLADRLVKTGSAPIVLNGYDKFWGVGRDGLGDNNLGGLLEKIRSELQFVKGINPTGFDCDEEKVPTLQDAIMNNPDNELAKACQALFVGSIALTSLVDINDFDAGFLSRRTGLPIEIINDAIKKLQGWNGAINTLKDLLTQESNGSNPSLRNLQSEPDWGDVDDDEWLSSNID